MKVKSKTWHTRSGFTLVELILVVLIIAMASAIAVPSFVNSIKGARLRTSARKVVSTNKYARSMAVLRQQQVLLRYNFNRSQMEIAFMPARTEASTVDRLLESGELFGEAMETATEEQVDSARAEQTRKLEEGVTIIDFTGVDGRGDDSANWITYYPNGMCDAHSFRLLDSRDQEVLVEVEAFTGDVVVEYVQ